MLPGEKGNRSDQQAECAGEVAVCHFRPRLGDDDWAFGEVLFGFGQFVRRIGDAEQVAVAARPVGATESGILEADVGAERDHAEGEDRGDQDQRPKEAHHRTWLKEVIGDQRRENERQVDDRPAEGAPGEVVTVVPPEPKSVAANTASSTSAAMR